MKLLQLISTLANLLADPDGVFWTTAELRGYLYEAECSVVALRPDATGTLQDVALATGAEQPIPSDGARLLKVMHNVSVGGAPGRVVRLGDMPTVDALSPDWRSEPGSATVREYFVDDREPAVFWVYPPAASGARLRLLYVRNPAAYPGTGDADLTVPDDFMGAVLEWALYRAFSKGGENADPGRAGGHLSNFYQLLGIKRQADQASDPRARP